MKMLKGNTVTFGDDVIELDDNHPLDYLVMKAAMDVDDAYGALDRALYQVARDTESAQKALHSGHMVNALGVYQTTAVRADQAAATYAAEIEKLRMTIWALKNTRKAEAK